MHHSITSLPKMDVMTTPEGIEYSYLGELLYRIVHVQHQRGDRYVIAKIGFADVDEIFFRLQEAELWIYGDFLRDFSHRQEGDWIEMYSNPALKG